MQLKRYMRIAGIFALLLGVVVVFGYTHSTNAEIIEKLADREQGANDLPEHPPLPDTSAEDVFPPLDTSGGVFITGVEYRFQSVQDWLDAFTGAAQKTSAPEVEIKFTNNAPEGGDEVLMLALPTNFETIYFEMYFAWCVGDNTVRLNQNGIVAGGTRIPFTGNVENGATDCYSDLTRDPAALNLPDSDGDGIDDRWETKYFGTLDEDLTVDLDVDGFELDEDNAIQGPEGPLTVTPDTYNAASGQVFITCDGIFTSEEEYIWGTNPLDPDTDDDGYGDEEDVCGKGQIAMNYPTPDDLIESDTELVEVIAAGISFFREGEGRIEQAKIANSGKTIYYGKGNDLRGEIEYFITTPANLDPTGEITEEEAQPNIYATDTVEFRADVENAKAQEGNLHYQWEFTLIDGGTDFPDTPNILREPTIGPIPPRYGDTDTQMLRDGFGLNPIRLCLGDSGQVPTDPDCVRFENQPKAGNSVLVKVKVTEPETAKELELSEIFNVSNEITLDFNPDLPWYPRFPLADEDSVPDATISVAAGIDNPDNYLFEWYIDEQKQPNNSIGGDSITLKPTKLSGEYKIKLIIVKKADEEVLARIEETVPVEDPRVSITNCDAYRDPNNPVLTGTLIDLDGAFHYYGTFDTGELVYEWRISDSVFQEIIVPGTSPLEQDNITFPANESGSYIVEFTVKSQESPSSAVLTRFISSTTCVINVFDTPPTGFGDRISGLYANLSASFPDAMRSIAKFSALLLVISIFSYIIFVRMQIKSKS